MKLLAITCAGLWTFAPTIARAEPTADQLRADGEQLAKDGRYSEAIAAFKGSNKLHERATNYCLIGLAYTRRELWPQAEIMIDRCKRYAMPDDPLPDWLPALDETLAARLASVDVAPIEIVVEPAGAKAKLSLSSFAPDELFEPRIIHLPPGRYVLVVTADGFHDAQRTIEVTGRVSQRIVTTLAPIQQAPPQPVNPRPRSAAPASTLPLVMIGGGAALIVAGAIYHATAFRTAANELADATDTTPDPSLYDQWSHRFDVRRDTAIGLYAAGALALGVGLVLRYAVHGRESDVQVSATPTSGGGIVSVGWAR